MSQRYNSEGAVRVEARGRPWSCIAGRKGKGRADELGRKSCRVSEVCQLHFPFYRTHRRLHGEAASSVNSTLLPSASSPFWIRENLTLGVCR